MMSPIPFTLSIAALSAVALNPTVGVQSGDEKKDSKAAKIERVADQLGEALGRKIEQEVEAWAERFAKDMESWASRSEKDWEKWAQDLEHQFEGQAGDWEKWAEQNEQHWEKWGDEYARQWEDWGERYARQWEDWAQQLESGSFEDPSQIIDGFARNLSSLEHMPIDQLASGLARSPLGAAPWSEMGGIEDLVERSLATALEGIEDMPVDHEELARTIAKHTEALSKAARGLHGQRAHRSGWIDGETDVRWAELAELLQSLHSSRSGDDKRDDKRGDGARSMRRPKGALPEEIRRRIAERVEQLREDGDPAETDLIDRLARERSEIERREAEVEALRRQVEELRREVERLREQRSHQL